MSEWISIEDGLPITKYDDFDNYTEVLVIGFDGESVYPIIFAAGKTIKFWSDWYDGAKITHWMPLPEPPEE